MVAARILYRLGESSVGGVERSGAAKRAAELRKQRRAFGRHDCKESAGTLEERRRRSELAAIERASSRASEEVAPLQCDLTGLGADPTEFRSGEVCLFEVVTDDLVLPRQLHAGSRFKPESEPQMEIGAELLRHGSIGDVSDEHMVEPEAVVGLVEGAVRPNQLLSRQGKEDAA